MATDSARPTASARPWAFITKPVSLTAARTFSLVSSVTSGESLSARDAVARDTPATRATSPIVTLARPARGALGMGLLRVWPIFPRTARTTAGTPAGACERGIVQVRSASVPILTHP